MSIRLLRPAIITTITQASSWEVPVGYIEPAAPAKPKDGPCAAGTAWSCSTDPTSGLQYWYNSASQQSTWEKPGEYVHPTDESEKAAAEAAKAAAKAAAASAGLDHLGNVEGKGAGDALGLLRLPGKSRAEKAIEKLEPAPEAPTTVPMNLAAANMGGAAVLPQAPKDSAWVVCTDASTGYVYYFNKLTKESSWEKPADLGLDLSKPPPAPPKKAPPPPAKGEKSSAAAPQVGMWEEVRPEQSQWDAGRKDPTVAAQDKDSDEEREVDPLVAMKFLTAHKGAWMDEDYERHEVEKVEKASSSRPVDVKSTFEKKGDLSFVKRGIRKRDDETDFCNV